MLAQTNSDCERALSRIGRAGLAGRVSSVECFGVCGEKTEKMSRGRIGRMVVAWVRVRECGRVRRVRGVSVVVVE